MEYTKEEKEAIDEAKTIVSIKYGSIMHIEIRNMEKILNLLEKQQKELEMYKRIAEMDLKEGEEFKNEMCKHRCILKSDLEENYISKEVIRKKIKKLQNDNNKINNEMINCTNIIKMQVLDELLRGE